MSGVPGWPHNGSLGLSGSALAEGTDEDKYHAFVDVEKQIATHPAFLSLPWIKSTGFHSRISCRQWGMLDLTLIDQVLPTHAG